MNRRRWVTHVGRLLIRSQPYRGLMILMTVVTVLVSTTSASITALAWSPQQRTTHTLGSTESVVQSLAQESQLPGSELGDPAWSLGLEEGVATVSKWSTQVPLGINGNSLGYMSYVELEMPSPVMSGSVELLEGRWPNKPGECVTVSQASGQAVAPIGDWSLTIVGEIRIIFSPGDEAFYCAPGTWQTWSMTEQEQEASRNAISVSFYFQGETSAVARVIARLTSEGNLGPVDALYVTTRQELLLSADISAQRFLSEQVPLLLIPFSLALVLAGRLSRWCGVVSRALVRTGVPEVTMRHTMAATTIGGTSVAIIAGGVIGALTSLAIRPVLQKVAWWKPLSEWQMPIIDLMMVLVSGVMGTVLGVLAGDSIIKTRLRQQDRAPQPLSSTAATVMGLIGAGIGVVALWILMSSEKRVWWVISGSMVMIIAFAAQTPLLVRLITRFMSSRVVSASTLAGRLIVNDSRRWSVVTSTVSVVLGVVFTSFTIGASSVAGQVLLEASPIPAGSVRIEIQSDGEDPIPETTLERFENDLGLTLPAIRLTELNCGYPGPGLLQGVDSIHDAERLLGELPPAVIDVLQQGGVVVVGQITNGQTSMPAQQFMGSSDPTIVSLPMIEHRPDPAHRYDTGAGFVLTSALPDILRSAGAIRTWNVYQGLTASQDVKARAWSAETGFNAFQIQAYRPSDGFSMPTRLAISLIGFGLLFAPIFALVLRNDVRSLSGLAATLSSVGLSRRWVRLLFRALTGVVVTISVVVALLAALAAIIVLSLLYPGVFDLVGTPWWMLAVLVLALITASQLAVRVAMKGLRKRKYVITI